jgi:hypothetical protein
MIMKLQEMLIGNLELQVLMSNKLEAMMLISELLQLLMIKEEIIKESGLIHLHLHYQDMRERNSKFHLRLGQMVFQLMSEMKCHHNIMKNSLLSKRSQVQ